MLDLLGTINSSHYLGFSLVQQRVISAGLSFPNSAHSRKKFCFFISWDITFKPLFSINGVCLSEATDHTRYFKLRMWFMEGVLGSYWIDYASDMIWGWDLESSMTLGEAGDGKPHDWVAMSGWLTPSLFLGTKAPMSFPWLAVLHHVVILYCLEN